MFRAFDFISIGDNAESSVCRAAARYEYPSRRTTNRLTITLGNYKFYGAIVDEDGGGHMEFGEMVYWWHRDWDEMYVTHTHDTLTFWARQTRERI